MFGWFRRKPALPGTALAMVGPRSSDEVLVLGAQDPSLAADIGAVTRLNGRTVVVGETEADEARTEEAAKNEGALLEFVKAPVAPIPFAASTFHILVVPDFAGWSPAVCSPRLAEAMRVLRPGGRIVLLLSQAKRPAKTAAGAGDTRLTSKQILDLLSVAGFSAARKLAEAEGTEYYEARKSR